MGNIGWQIQQNPQPNTISQLQNSVITPDNPEITLASFPRRFTALLIDQIILVSFAALLGGFTAYIRLLFGGGPTNTVIAQQLYTFIVVPTYFIFFWTLTNGRSPGKILLKLQIVRTDGGPITLGTSIIRFIGYLISAAIFWLGFLWALFDANQQGLHDKLAGTQVMKVDSGSRKPVVILFIFYELAIIMALILIVILGRAFRN